MKRPRTRFARLGDERIAYQVVGDGPVDLVMTVGSAGNIDMLWDNDDFSELYRRLSEFTRLILFDARGTGVSDPLPEGGSRTWESWSEDLVAVMDAAGSERAAIAGVLDASPAAILCAAIRPERVRSLILFNSTARWAATDDYDAGWGPAEADALMSLLPTLWGTADIARLTHPTRADDSEFCDWFARYLRSALSPRVFGEHLEHLMALDVRHALSTVSVPTLVMHRRDNQLLPIAMGRYLAENIPGSQFVELPGGGGLGIENLDEVVGAIRTFLTGHRSPEIPSRVLSTVLFSDIVDSTGRLARLGDQRWDAALDRHDRVARSCVAEFRGRAVSSTGDGMLATFDAPTRALSAAFSMREALAADELEIRVGMHTGEIEAHADHVRGIGVHIAARVVREAAPGEVVVTRTVKDLTAGAQITFTPRGTARLKGVPDEWDLYTVEPA